MEQWIWDHDHTWQRLLERNIFFAEISKYFFHCDETCCVACNDYAQYFNCNMPFENNLHIGHYSATTWRMANQRYLVYMRLVLISKRRLRTNFNSVLLQQQRNQKRKSLLWEQFFFATKYLVWLNTSNNPFLSNYMVIHKTWNGWEIFLAFLIDKMFHFTFWACPLLHCNTPLNSNFNLRNIDASQRHLRGQPISKTKHYNFHFNWSPACPGEEVLLGQRAQKFLQKIESSTKKCFKVGDDGTRVTIALNNRGEFTLLSNANEKGGGHNPCQKFAVLNCRTP